MGLPAFMSLHWLRKPQEIAARLAKAKHRSLRIVTYAYKATPIRCLETETWVPPLGLYLKKEVSGLRKA
jgi:hypothetical protein